ncbi:MAG: ECF transporter S component [Lachnospiraceae bacterium]|nr:ECF transporter S component [Lachnospiraceae bacterium]
MRKAAKPVTLAVLFLLIPAAVFAGLFVFREKSYTWISLCVAVLSLVPLLVRFERRESAAMELTVIAVMAALSAAGRFIFAWVPGFKPVTAIVMISGAYLTGEAGFVIGALSAVVSKFYFGQGPWTPFQMFAWGLTGYLSGVLSKPLRQNRVLFAAAGALCGVFYSLVLDVFTSVWADGVLDLPRYISVAVSSLPTTLEYAVSNVVFILLLEKPIGKKLTRVRTKYGLFRDGEEAGEATA